MAGNIQADASGNIYVEFDYNNIILVDPNKTTDSFNKKILLCMPIWSAMFYQEQN